MFGRALALALLITPFAGAAPVWGTPTNSHVLAVTNLEALSAPDPVQLATPAAPRVIGTGLLPAPLPDPDVDGPHESAGLGPGLTPALFHEKAVFQGNGFSPASNLDHGINERRAPAAGLNWTVPVK
jgi:hypothetical protein